MKAKKYMKNTPQKEPQRIFDIDPNRLDEEWINQPTFFYEYAVKLAESRRTQSETKAELEVVKAEVERDIRNDPAAFDIPKPTESAITSAIVLQKEYQIALKAHRDACYDVDMHFAATNALDHRKSALERLVSLHGQSYFASPVPKDEPSKDIITDSTRRRARQRTQN